ncbi:MAG: type III-A CRISPR-associated RAMP protein Csm5, partial [Candidatus Cloacimonas sp.]|nr:type III-A CRISPR-associated RAMP protein Csm5 [Candidatus Cloacimonas sp.]
LTGNPYLPGSSIKGAIRTALLAKRLVNPTERIDKLANGIISDRDLEPKIFRYLNNWRKPDITNDPFKFLKVSDIEFPADYLTLRVVENAKKSPNEERKHTPQELEYLCQAVRKGSDPLIGIIQIHKCWQDDNPMLQIVAACSAFFKTKLNEDKIFYTAHNPALHKILCELPDKCAANECFLRLGKATGIVHKSINPQQPQTRSLIGGMPMGICKLSFEELI